MVRSQVDVFWTNHRCFAELTWHVCFIEAFWLYDHEYRFCQASDMFKQNGIPSRAISCSMLLYNQHAKCFMTGDGTLNKLLSQWFKWRFVSKSQQFLLGVICFLVTPTVFHLFGTRSWGVSWSWCAVPAASSACRSTPLVKDLFKKVPACLYLSLCFSISGPETAMFFGLPAVIRQDWNFHVFFCGMEDAIPSFLVVGRWIKRSSWSQASLPRREGMTHQLRTRGVSKHLCVRFFCPTD